MANNSKEEPKTGPEPDRWYNLTLGSSFNEDSSNKYCTLRYEFKPASIDKTKPGSLHKKIDNRVSVEFQNNLIGKPKVIFEGNSEDYKTNETVLFFDGKTFRLERLHRAVKQLRHVRRPGESASAVTAAQLGAVMEPKLSAMGKGPKTAQVGKSTVPAVPVEVERIDIGQPDNSGAKPAGKGIVDPFEQPNVTIESPDPKSADADEHEDVDIDEIFGAVSPYEENAVEQKEFDTSAPQHDSDEEIADVDDSGDEANKGPNAAEALRAQVHAAEEDERSSSSSSSSGSGSSGSSSSSDSSDEDSVTSV